MSTRSAYEVHNHSSERSPDTLIRSVQLNLIADLNLRDQVVKTILDVVAQLYACCLVFVACSDTTASRQCGQVNVVSYIHG